MKNDTSASPDRDILTSYLITDSDFVTILKRFEARSAEAARILMRSQFPKGKLALVLPEE